jgi:hypothetical protein
MEMAARGDDAPAVLAQSTSRDRHRHEIADALRAAGLIVRQSVGLSDFTVDLAVAENEDGPWTGVFLDGPVYARRKTVADRESLPYAVLTDSMGWSRIVRVWLPDWVRDREEVIARVRLASATVPAHERTPKTSLPGGAAPVAQSPAGSVAVANETPVVATTRLLTSDALATRTPTAIASAATRSGTGQAAVDLSPSPAGTPGSKFIPAHVRVAGPRDWLEQAGSDPRCRAAVLAEVEDVLAAEAPIATVRLARVVGRRFGMQRVFATRAASILAVVDRDRIEPTPFGDFAWGRGQDRDAYREFRTAENQSIRPVEEIAPRELINAMVYLARIGHGITREDLSRETAALFGYSRVASKVRGHLEAVIGHAIALGHLRDDGNELSPGQEFL